MAILLPEGKQSFVDGAGIPLAGGRLYTYAAGTTTPKTTWADSAESAPNTNPIILDARGEATVFWNGAYKVELRNAVDVVIWTVDNAVATVATATSPYDVLVPRMGDALAANETFLVMSFVRAVTFPANFTGSLGRVESVNPAATYQINLTRNGGACGTVSISTAGAFTFTTTGGLPVSFSIGDRLVAKGQATPDVALSDWSFVLKGDRT